MGRSEADKILSTGRKEKTGLFIDHMNNQADKTIFYLTILNQIGNNNYILKGNVGT